MSFIIVVGAQWGDEGKGRVVDLLSAQADVVARYSGGDNAGHTVTVEDHTFKLHLIPSGIVHPHTRGLLGNGMVINPITLISEIDELEKVGVNITPERLFISRAAHLITPAHRLLDKVQEEARAKGKIGTTGRGIGPAYVDKATRQGIRAQDLLSGENTLRKKMLAHLETVDHLLQALYRQLPLDKEAIAEEFIKNAMKMAPYVCDISVIARKCLEEKKILLGEGAQGTLLDIDHGTYPFVTSSTTIAPGAYTGLGLGICSVDRIVGVTKVFQTRVGAGPFPTEASDEQTTLRLRGTGENPWDEFGTTTGRPRRVGWLDGVLLKYAVMLNGMTELALTKMDILSGLPTIKICTHYQVNQKAYDYPILGVEADQLGEYTPVYEDLEGWEQNITNVRRWEDLPAAARQYVQKIEEISATPVKMISVGPERSQIIIR